MLLAGSPWLGSCHGLSLMPDPSCRFAISTACMNRYDELAQVLPSWLCLNPSQILILDWGSSVSIEEYLTERFGVLPSVKVVRHEPTHGRWKLTHAFNLALSLANAQYILKLDCEHEVSPELLRVLHFAPNEFQRFRSLHQSEYSRYVNGAFFCPKCLLKDVNYYDERIDTYGWDDSDLYTRLSEIASSRIVDTTGIWHVAQTEASRTEFQLEDQLTLEITLANKIGVSCSVFLTLLNRYRSGSRIPWGNHYEAQYVVVNSEIHQHVPRMDSKDETKIDPYLESLAFINAVQHAYFISNSEIISVEHASEILVSSIEEITRQALNHSSMLQWRLYDMINFISQAGENHQLCTEWADLFCNSSDSQEIRMMRNLLIKQFLKARQFKLSIPPD